MTATDSGLGDQHRHHSSALPSAAKNFQGQRAGVVSRCLAAVVDLVAVAVLLASVYFAIAGVALLWDPKNAHLPSFSRSVVVSAGAVIAVVYLATGWATSGRTIGDQLLGLRVEGVRGDRLHLARSLVRAVVCVVFPIGLLLGAVDRSRRSVADLVVGSMVVYDWSSRALEDED
jgi:uncharacterized RDD family membrane protein YckC